MACYRWIALAGSVVACLTVPIIAYGQDLKYPPKPHREIDGSTLVLIEVWPTVQMR